MPSSSLLSPAPETVSGTWKMPNRYLLNEWALCLFALSALWLSFLWDQCFRLLRWWEGCGKMPLWSSLATQSLNRSCIPAPSHVQENTAHPLQHIWLWPLTESKSINMNIVQAYKRLSLMYQSLPSSNFQAHRAGKAFPSSWYSVLMAMSYRVTFAHAKGKEQYWKKALSFYLSQILTWYFNKQK